MPKGSKNALQIDALALGGRIFEILGVFLRALIFDEFSIGKKSAKNRENGGPWLLKAKFIDIWGGVGGKGGGHGRPLESDKSLKRVPNAHAPRAGAADFKASPHVADPRRD